MYLDIYLIKAWVFQWPLFIHFDRWKGLKHREREFDHKQTWNSSKPSIIYIYVIRDASDDIELIPNVDPTRLNERQAHSPLTNSDYD